MEHIVHSHIGDGKSLVLAQRKAQQRENRLDKIGLEDLASCGNGGDSLVPAASQPIAPTVSVYHGVDATTYENIWTRKDIRVSAYYTTLPPPGGNGPDWCQVYRRRTIDLDDGTLMEDIWITPCILDSRLHRQFEDKKKRNTKTELYYVISNDSSEAAFGPGRKGGTASLPAGVEGGAGRQIDRVCPAPSKECHSEQDRMTLVGHKRCLYSTRVREKIYEPILRCSRQARRRERRAPEGQSAAERQPFLSFGLMGHAVEAAEECGGGSHMLCRVQLARQDHGKYG